MKWKAASGFLLLTFAILASVPAAVSLASFSDFAVLSTNSLTMVGKVGDQHLLTTINMVGVANESVNVRLFSGELRDNTTGNIIPAAQMKFGQNGFDLGTAEEKAVDVNVTISGAMEGTYQGAIIILASLPSGQLSQSNIGVTVKIATDKSLFSPFSASFGLLILLIVVLIIVLVLGLKGESKGKTFKQFKWLERLRFKWGKSILIILLGVFAVYVWIYMLSTYTLGELSSAIATLIVVPLVTFVIAYVNERRTNSNRKADTSREIQSKAIEKDIESIRNILGELATHFASFKPNLYEESQSQTFTPLLKAMYHKDGIIARKVWNDFCKQGMMADLPVLELEKYYDFVNTYNLFYAYALTKTAKMNQGDFELVTKKPLSPEEKAKLDAAEKKKADEEEKKQKTLDKPFFDAFEEFRGKYADCETVLFVNLTFYLGLYTKTYLYEEKVEYPRVTRTLLKKLVDYKILVDDDFAETYEDTRAKDVLNDFEKRYPAMFTSEKLDEELKEFKQDHPESVIEPAGFAAATKLQEKAKEVIDKWSMTADALEDILEKIYHPDNIPIFYRKVEDDFQQKYTGLKKSLNGVVVPPDFSPDEKKLPVLDEIKTYKLLSEDLTALKKLLKEREITPEKYEELKKKIIEKT